jgi:hypothetical protein
MKTYGIAMPEKANYCFGDPMPVYSRDFLFVDAENATDARKQANAYKRAWRCKGTIVGIVPIPEQYNTKNVDIETAGQRDIQRREYAVNIVNQKRIIYPEIS